MSILISDYHVMVSFQDLLLPVAGCKGCKDGVVPFDPAASSTYAPVKCANTTKQDCMTCANAVIPNQCAYSDSYLTCDKKNASAICTVAGPVFSDVVQIGPWSAQAHLGGISTQTTNFDQFKEIDGILGLAYRAEGFNDSPWAYVAAANAGAVADVIQHCLTTDGGVLVFGQDAARDAAYYDGPLAWTPITWEAWYVVVADSMAVAGKVLPGINGTALNGPPKYPCIVDSGTNGLQLTPQAFAATVKAFKARCGGGAGVMPGVCDVPTGAKGLFDGAAWPLKAADIATFPTVTITLKGDRGGAPVPLTIGPEDYLIEYPKGQFTMLITNGLCIVGNTHMLKYWTVYDRANSRIGFAPTNPGACAAGRRRLLQKV